MLCHMSLEILIPVLLGRQSSSELYKNNSVGKGTLIGYYIWVLLISEIFFPGLPLVIVSMVLAVDKNCYGSSQSLTPAQEFSSL